MKKAFAWFGLQAFRTLIGLTVMALLFWGVRTMLFIFALWKLIWVFSR